MPQEKWSISREHAGSGSFMCPPGHPAFDFSIIEGPTRNPRAIMSIMTTETYVPESIRQRAALMIEGSTLVESEGWVRSVYGYFRGMYLAPDGSRDASKLLRGRDAAELGLNGPERHAAVAMVREFFPHHQPRLDLIADPGRGYGAYPCLHCGETVQYEARKDALCVPRRGSRWVYDAQCATSPNLHHQI